ncbi:MAG: NAD+ synthase [Candidatus Diapherotrites archaeon]|nr:NAD+ synthase [Candidatus Diapherotrites archaeon]
MQGKKLEAFIVGWLRQQVKKAGAKGVVFGLSGGIDSSVAAVLCKKAFPKNCLALAMPCNSDSSDLRHAKQLTRQFNIPLKEIDLSKPFECILQCFGENSAKENRKEIANIKPRLRMACLYFFANKLNYLVVGAGNKSELQLGYFTKFGDGAVDLLPIGALYKGEVKKLALHLGIEKEVIEKEPSAGLWKGQTDQSELGFSYKQLDKVIGAIESGKAKGISKKSIALVRKMIAGSEHKRRMPPICKID